MNLAQRRDYSRYAPDGFPMLFYQRYWETIKVRGTCLTFHKSYTRETEARSGRRSGAHGYDSVEV